MIDSIRLQHFRSYSDASFEFDGGVNIVIGPNASGKTNLLEAILVLASGKSFRAKDSDLIQFTELWARLDGFFGSQARTIKLIKEDDKALKTFYIEDKAFKRLNLEKTEPTVLFEPNHLQLITRGPEFRRQYFDDILERTQIGFKSLSASYRRALSQRNALLKQSPGQAKKQLFAWNIRLSELGAQIANARQELIDGINKSISKNYSQIASKRTKVELIYDTPFGVDNYSTKLLSKLESSNSADFNRGFTGFGPHREDFVLKLNKKQAALAASRGETRSLLIALKIFELGLIEKVRGAKPVFLLDDVFSELDGARRRHLVEHLKNYQTIITTTDADAVVEYFSQNHNLISL
ncbi:MAG TPA: DNA replication and repair protein RecF [Candidatus Saccharimonadales bacterium]|nr:DNA replication and repair protein RecF [Candidatus Saccharimonadales bacterium]